MVKEGNSQNRGQVQRLYNDRMRKHLRPVCAVSCVQFAAILMIGLIGSAPPALAQKRIMLSYMGAAGWEISDGTTIILIDPYLTRPQTSGLSAITGVVIQSSTLGGTIQDSRPTFTPADVIKSDEAVIDAHIKRADYILITHTHFDHTLDMPYIAKKTGAVVIGTESTLNFARASGVAETQLMTVKGGEDFQFGAFSLRVIPSLHGVLPRPRAPLTVRPEVFPADAKPPIRLSQLLVEGGTLAYLIRVGDRQVLAFGSHNYIEREIEGIRPDVVLVGAAPQRNDVYDYTARLLRVLGYPRMVIPTHWDRINVAYDVSQEAAIKRLQPFLAEVKAASPNSQVVVPEYFHPIQIGPDR